MRRKQRIYTAFHITSGIIMILALLWLTISTPFVYAAQQELARQDKVSNTNAPLAGTEEEAANPFGSTTEEKAPSSTSVSEEYLHDHHTSDHFFSIASQYHKCENSDAYIAFHGELHVPPPNVA